VRTPALPQAAELCSSFLWALTGMAAGGGLGDLSQAHFAGTALTDKPRCYRVENMEGLARSCERYLPVTEGCPSSAALEL
jgi:hypothetical protein